MTAAWAVVVAVVFVWLGMVVAISFIEAPLKFRAPGITVQLGLGIGRLVFRALNAAELLLAVTALVALWFHPPPAPVIASISVAVVVLAIQLLVVRPLLTRRSGTVLAGGHSPRRSHAHYVYVGLEVMKVIALACMGTMLLAG